MTGKKKLKRITAGFLAAVLTVTGAGIPFPLPSQASDIWPQKATAPFYCIDGGKSWRQADRYENYKYDSLPSPLSDTQARRLFWAYPKNWSMLKLAAQVHDPELYGQIASTSSGPNTVKRVKDDGGTKFAWVADNPEIEARAIAAIEQMSAGESVEGKEAPEAIRDATSEETAVPFVVLPFSDGPGALETEFVLGESFIRDIARIEPQSVWDNGSTGGAVGWLDASQDKNIAKSAMGEELYEVTWSGNSIKIRNNGSAIANDNAVGSDMSEEEKYNKTMVRYKITMRQDSGWYTEGSWNGDYLHEWMDFKACVNAPEHQRLYKADIQIVPSDMVFYIVISQEGSDTPGTPPEIPPEEKVGEPKLDFQIFKHEETFEANYRVRLKKYDDETGMPLKGSQFYLYERFEDADLLGESQRNGGLAEENLSFRPWEGFQVFYEGTTNAQGEVSYGDVRKYAYSKTYCNGHPAPEWAQIPEEDEGENEEQTEGEGRSDAAEQTKDNNRAAAAQWLEWVEDCEREQEEQDTHFHWMTDEGLVEEVRAVLESGEPGESSGDTPGSREAFEKSGCREDCEKTYETFIGLRFTYTWKEIQARTGYILHGLHADDIPVEMITTTSSEDGAKCVRLDGSSEEIEENIWYTGTTGLEDVLEQLSLWRFRVDEAETRTALGSAIMIEAKAESASNADFNIIGKAGKEELGPESVFDAVSNPIRRAGKEKQRPESASDAVSAVIEENTKRNVRPNSASNAVPNPVGKSGNREKKQGNQAHMRIATSSNGQEWKEQADEKASVPSASNAAYRQMALLLETRARGLDDSGWDSMEGEESFGTYLETAEADGIRHLDTGESHRFSHCNGQEECGDSWRIYDHRTEGRLHINKKSLDLYKKESEEYASYGDAEGDATLEGAVYGLFAAEDILHPDSDVSASGTVTNTGTVYLRNDLVSMATTDENGDADFLVYTQAPGMTYDYETGMVKKRTDIVWDGPGNRYKENQEKNGNYWIGRPLILGNYYIKELSRSEGFELSINGLNEEWTNYGTGFDTPAAIASAHGTAVLSLPELSGAMEGEDGGGPGYDQISFSVTSSGTSDEESGTDGYDILTYGFPEGTQFYRVDTGEEEVTGPHVTGAEEVIVRDDEGEIVWQRAESDKSHVRYVPEYDENGNLTGQTPMSQVVPQIIKAERIPEQKRPVFTDLSMEPEPMLEEAVMDFEFRDDGDPAFETVKRMAEELLDRNGYEVPVTADGLRSMEDALVYSRGVRKGEPDVYGLTAKAGEPALRTVYGAATEEVSLQLAQETTVGDVIFEVVSWYQNHSQWSFGGIDAIRREGNQLFLTLYKGVPVSSNSYFFVSGEENGVRTVEQIYAVLQNPEKLQWMYQEYGEGTYEFQIERQYYIGNGEDKRYYVDAVLTPAVLVEQDGTVREITHRVMVYHGEGEEIVDYLTGDPENGYRVPMTRLEDKIEITSEMEMVEKDVPLMEVSYDPVSESHRIHVKTTGTDSFGWEFSDREGGLTLQFMARLPRKNHILTEEDIRSLEAGNVYGYTAGETIGYGIYLMRVSGASIAVDVSGIGMDPDTYIVTKKLVYRGQDRISEDGETKKAPIQVLERPIKQKVQVKKELEGEPAIKNFRFKIYLKSNLERLYCDENGQIVWLNEDGKEVDIDAYREAFPELVQKIFTKETGRRLLEEVKDEAVSGEETYRWNYEKFFDAIRTADIDKWHNQGELVNTSFKPFAVSLLTGTVNQINTSYEAAENAKRSDAVRQFAVTWYLEDTARPLIKNSEKEGIAYTDETYDKALYQAILQAEAYLEPFFRYDIDTVYEILWDSEENGGLDMDLSTLSASHLAKNEGESYAYGISSYLPYGDYVLSEQQPYRSEWLDYANKHYEIDKPRELSLPAVYEQDGDILSSRYVYQKEDTPSQLAEKYLIRFNEEWAENQTQSLREYLISGHNHDGDFEIYPYGLSEVCAEGHYEPYQNPVVAGYYHYRSDSEEGGEDEGTATMTGVKTAYDGEYAPMLVPWSVTDPEAEAGDMTGYGIRQFLNRRYQVRLRVEKLDQETGEPILHDEGIFALYQAERDESPDGDGAVKRYETDTVITGSLEFLKAMKARQIMPLARSFSSGGGPGNTYYGTVPAGTPVCREQDLTALLDENGLRTGMLQNVSTMKDIDQEGILQNTGYFVTPEPLKAGVYVLAELKPPEGYVGTGPIAIEIYSDQITYAPAGQEEVSAVVYSYGGKTGEGMEKVTETARIYASNTATSLEISKEKTVDSSRSMKISGRVEGTISYLKEQYGLENLELAYNQSGTYLGFGWKKGTLEYLENRREHGERIEIVYEDGIFQGYGYVTRLLETASQENRYVAGAVMALYEAIEVKGTGDKEDYTFEGVEIVRDRNGNVSEILVKEGYAGSRYEYVRVQETSDLEDEILPGISGEGVWTMKAVLREDTPVLFYDLGGLKVMERGADGMLYGYDRDGRKQKITFDTRSIYALKWGRPAFEISGGDFSQLVYDSKAKAFTSMDSDTALYHLDENLCRDAQVDGYTGLAYIEKTSVNESGKEEVSYYVWPVELLCEENGTVLERRKILTGRPGEIGTGTDMAYLTGTWNAETKRFEKKMNPVLDSFGLAEFYRKQNVVYQKGSPVYDRDGDYIGYEYDDLLESYNRATFAFQEAEKVLSIGDPEKEEDDWPLYHRKGEAFLIPNIWMSGEKTPNDPTDFQMTAGQPDLLRRVIPGTYILEELEAPKGYAKAFPSAVSMEEKTEIQRVSVTDEKTKVEISKVDGSGELRVSVENMDAPDLKETVEEEKGAYTWEPVTGACLALFKAQRVYTSDYTRYPKGYYLVKAEETPAMWTTDNFVDSQPVSVTAMWITEETPQYFEGIPAGDYILEELETPEGRVPASMEITVDPVGHLQSFILYNDHTKLEIYKYERGEQGEKKLLPVSGGARLELYPAVTDELGNVQMEDGRYLYDAERKIDSWIAADFSQEYRNLMQEYEHMFSVCQDSFQEFSWKRETEGEIQWIRAALEKSESTGNQETVTQLWKLEDGSQFRVTAVKNGRSVSLDDGGQPEYSFEYQFRYRKADSSSFAETVSYDMASGIHRIDRLPAGQYILVETETPEGYWMADPKLITVEQTGIIRRYEMENRRIPEPEEPWGELVIKKLDAENGTGLLGARFEVENKQTGERFQMETGADGMAVSGKIPAGERKEDGTWQLYEYEVKEIHPPKGYAAADERWRFSFQPGAEGEKMVHELVIENEGTTFFVSKTDEQTGQPLTEARFAIYKMKTENGFLVLDGGPIETWLSDKEPHMICGKLEGGSQYLLTEMDLPEGYAGRETLLFTVSEDGKTVEYVKSETIEVKFQAASSSEGIRLEAIGSPAKEIQYVLERDGYPVAKEELEYGDVLTLKRQVVFSDGTRVPAGRKTFRLTDEAETSGIDIWPEREQIQRTEFLLRESSGNILARQELTEEEMAWKLGELTEKDGKKIFQPGSRVYLEQVVTLENGVSLVTERKGLCIDEKGNLTELCLENRKTRIEISKKDMATGEELPGASLTLTDEDGNVVDSWISAEEPHHIEGELKAGGRYTLTEVLAPNGYEEAESITFTVSSEGEINRVVMEDKPKPEEPEEPTEPEVPTEPEEPKKPEEPTEPEEPTKPEEPTSPEEPEEPETPARPENPDGPDRSETPETPVLPERTWGSITAHYENKNSYDGILRLEQPGRFYPNIPDTGDRHRPVLYLIGAAAGLLGISFWMKRRRDET